MKLYNVQDVAKRFGISEYRVRDLVAEGKLPSDQKLGGRLFFTDDNLDKLANLRGTMLRQRILFYKAGVRGRGRPARLARDEVDAALEAINPSKGPPVQTCKDGAEWLGTQRVEGTERQKEAKRLRFAGATLDKIGKHFGGISRVAASYLVNSHGFNGLLAWYEGERFRKS